MITGSGSSDSTLGPPTDRYSPTEFRVRQAIRGRVDDWRGGGRCGISVAAPFGSRCPTSHAMTPFPVAAHRTGHADLPHPALGQDACLRPRKVAHMPTEQQQGWRTPAVLTALAACTQPSTPPLGRSFALRIEIRIVPSLQHVVPSAASADFWSFVGSPQSPVRRHFQRQP
jgi:hypothetical protein